MRTSIIVTLSKIIALGLIFIAPLIHLSVEYGGSETQVVEVTTNSMPMAILILISIFVVTLIAYIGSSAFHAIQDSPFGFGGIYMFGAIILGISILALYWINKIDDLVNYNVVQFLNDLDTYKDSVQYIIAYIVAGLVIATAGYIYKKTQ